MNLLQRRWEEIVGMSNGAKGLGGVSVSSLEMAFYCGAATMGVFAMTDQTPEAIQQATLRTMETNHVAAAHAMRPDGAPPLLPRRWPDPNTVDEGWDTLLEALDNPANKASERHIDVMRFAYYNGANYMGALLASEAITSDDDVRAMLDFARARILSLNDYNLTVRAHGGLHGSA